MVFSCMQPADMLYAINQGGISLGFDIFYLVLRVFFRGSKMTCDKLLGDAPPK